ncbi:non-homologous end joining protein Ku [Roseitranquillus sediminis]|uniref:non-homologous end joining protein Ku n=1 Tax=Roseitranquillus sediminis TaxID=2809051 RepID=UPI001D0C7F49|nr:Ku protein [Roseitranquillus sediminis]MBM9595582.1 Ku protein [Roseitranquillus sediminis]
MASRAVWKGQLRLSLVSIPVEIHSATQSGARVSFRQIHGPSGKRVRYEKVVPGVGPVDSSEILKGYETGGDEYILLEPEEIDEIKLETKKTLELVQFVGACEISPLWYDRPYYVVPTDDLAEDAYRVVRDALRKADKVGLGQLVMRGREYLCALRPCGDGLLLETLHYADEIRKADPLFSGIEDDPADEELLAVATQLIDRKTAPFEAASFEDRYDKALRELIDAKTKSKKTRRVATGDSGESKPAGGENVVDLMDALKKSLQSSGKGSKSSGKSTRPKAAAGDKPATKSSAKPAAKSRKQA